MVKEKIFNEILGKHIEIPRPVKKVISLSSGLTDTIFMMGLGDIVIATDAFSNKPPEAKSKPKVASYTHVNIDLIRKLDPELIISITGVQRRVIDEIMSQGLNIYPLPMPTNIADIISNTIVLGNVLGYSEHARRLASKLYTSIQDISNKTQRVGDDRLKVLVVLDFGPVGGFWSPGSSSHICDAVWLVGGECITDSIGSAYMEFEEVLRKIDSVDIIIYENASYYSSDRPLGLEKVDKLLEKFNVDIGKRIVFREEVLAHTGPWLIMEGLNLLYKSIWE